MNLVLYRSGNAIEYYEEEYNQGLMRFGYFLVFDIVLHDYTSFDLKDLHKAKFAITSKCFPKSMTKLTSFTLIKTLWKVTFELEKRRVKKLNIHIRLRENISA